jgi:thiol-disulfide isomerase/thioredoxin
MNADQLKSEFHLAKPYTDYLATGTDEQRRRWTAIYDAARLTPQQSELVKGFTREMYVLIVSGIWCGDCVEQCPLLQRIAEANPAKVHLRLCDRDERKELSTQLRLNGGDRVPVALFCSEDFELCGLYGDRTLHRYRALALKFLGAACPTGIGGPDPDEVGSTLADWLNEFERIQLMLRLSPRLRQRYGD